MRSGALASLFRSDPMEEAGGILICVCSPAWAESSAAAFKTWGGGLQQMMRVLVRSCAAGTTAEAKGMRYGTAFTIAYHHLDSAVGSPGWSWAEVMGEGGALLREAMRCYDYDAHHDAIVALCSVDGAGCGPSLVWPALVHFGDLALARELAAAGRANAARMLASGEAKNALSNLLNIQLFPQVLHLLGQDAEGAEYLAGDLEAAVEQIAVDFAGMVVRGDADAGIIHCPGPLGAVKRP